MQNFLKLSLVVVGLLIVGQFTALSQQNCTGCVTNDTLCVAPANGLTSVICGDTVFYGSVSQSFDQDITILLPERFTVKVGDPIPGIGIPSPFLIDVQVTSFIIDDVTGLPSGLNWACDSVANGCKYAPSFVTPTACIKVCGDFVCDDQGDNNFTINFTYVQKIDPSIFGGVPPPGFNLDSLPANGSFDLKIVVDPSSSVATISSNKPTTVGAGETVVLTSTSGFDSYVWSTGDTTESVSVVPTESTIYSLTVTDANGCEQVVSYSQTVLPTGIEEMSSNLVTLFPNPASTFITIINEGTIDNNSSLKIYDVKGKVVKNMAYNTQHYDVSELQSGIYIVELQIKNKTYSKKLIIQ